MRGLLADGLIDHLHLFIYPVALGQGMKLFAEGVDTRLALQGTDTYPNGVVHIDYGPA